MWHCVQIRLFWSFFFFALKASSSLIFSSHFKMYSVNARLPSFIFGVFSFRDTKKKFKVLSIVRIYPDCQKMQIQVNLTSYFQITISLENLSNCNIHKLKKCKSKSIWRVISKMQLHLKISSKYLNTNILPFTKYILVDVIFGPKTTVWCWQLLSRWSRWAFLAADQKFSFRLLFIRWCCSRCDFSSPQLFSACDCSSSSM